MSDSQFAYSHLTLDELRSMAASPQVGTMQAMPQSFRALADRVGEVADLLTHAQADLPNWWKGPAAVQAAATLGRAAAEARDFHGSAVAAASVVSRCAQVVAAQQNQMMDVPDIAEPGVTAVVQHPTTPFEALEAARQDATYQAAHEQAVQVVNGIAAQYVETRDELGMITTTRGEGFTDSTPYDAHLPEAGNTSKPDRFEYGITAENNTTRDVDSINVHSSRAAVTKLSHPIAVSSELRSKQSAAPNSPSRDIESLTALGLAMNDHGSNSSAGRLGKGEISPAIEYTTRGDTHHAPGIDIDQSTPTGIPGAQDLANILQPILTREPRSEQSNCRPVHQSRSERNSNAAGNERVLRSLSRATFEGYDPMSGIEIDRSSRSGNIQPFVPSEPAYDSHSGSNDSSALIPPYSGVGHTFRPNEEHSPCPPYLKERKSTWLPDTVAAPADGVITPDWCHHI